VRAIVAVLLVACSAERPAAPVKVVSAPPSSVPRAASELPRTHPAPAETPPWPPAPPPEAGGDFCTPIVTALDDDSCYVLPDSPPRELLIYLHGIVPPQATSTQKTNFQTVVANASRRAGVAALLPRGRRGLAPKGHDAWWGWPTAVADYAALAGELVSGFAEKRRKLEVLVGRPFERLYVAGSSSGAYFVVALALNGGITADGFGAMSGGAFRQTASKSAPVAPFYVGYGTRDNVGESARLLAKRLREARWPVELAAHPLPHGAAEVYLDEAIAFWRKNAP
jgi:predicted esterase